MKGSLEQWHMPGIEGWLRSRFEASLGYIYQWQESEIWWWPLCLRLTSYVDNTFRAHLFVILVSICWFSREKIGGFCKVRVTWLSFCVSDNTIKLLKELTSKKSLQVPSIYYHLPHLLQNEGSLQPAVQIGSGRTGGACTVCLLSELWLGKGFWPPGRSLVGQRVKILPPPP